MSESTDLTKATVHLTYAEDRDGWQALYLGNELVHQSDTLDWFDLLDALAGHPAVKFERLYFKDRPVEDWPQHLDDVLMWQVA